MASLSLRHIYKVYDGKVKAVNDFSMEIKDKEFIVFVGPSGCGKSTTLRMIAGLEEITAGDLYIEGVLVNDVEPKDRDIAMVFQNYALYPHMTVFENMAFGLRIRKMSKEEIRDRVNEAARILGIEDLLERQPKALSGGQRQRVALGRAIVREPKVFLLDEPLSNLDAKLRTQMRTEITKLHKKLQTTFIYVTHDQVEAMTMGTRIVVMRDGFIQQIDSPQNLYSFPYNRFVAGFIGTPQMNFFDANLTLVGDKVKIKFAGCAEITVPYEKLIKVDPEYFDGRTVVMGLRPQSLTNDPHGIESNPDAVIECSVQLVEELGSETNVFGDVNIHSQSDNIIDISTNVTAKSDPSIKVIAGETIKLVVDIDNIHLFDKETEITIKPRLPQFNKTAASVENGVLTAYGERIKLPEAIAEQMTGKYDKLNVIIPSESVLISDKGVKARVFNDETINDNRLLTLILNDNVLFAAIPNDLTIGDTVNIEFDMKGLSFTSAGETVVKALPLENKLSGMLVKTKIDGKNAYAYQIGGDILPVDLALVNKLVTSAGKKVFSTELTFSFCAYKAKGGASGLKVEYVRTLNYGRELFDEYRVNNETVFILSDGTRYSSIGVDIADIGVTETKLDMKLL